MVTDRDDEFATESLKTGDAMLPPRIDPIQNFNTELQNIGKTMAGDAAAKALVGKAKSAWKKTQDAFNVEKARIAKALEDSCFVAGTLVHTINGLVPIEQIKVGDLVLSKHESGQGEREYKPVTQTFVHYHQPVHLVRIGRDRDVNGHKLQNQTEADCSNLLVTGNHPFYERVDYYGQGEYPRHATGWKEIQNIGVSGNVETLDGVGQVYTSGLVYHSKDPGVAFVPDQDPRWEDYGGKYFNYLPEPDLSTLQFAHVVPRNIDRYEIPLTVYNFEVQDNHTYYVGTIGVWVHNKKVRVLNEQQVSDLTGKESGKLHVQKESFPRTGIPTNSQAYALKTRGVQKIEGGTANPVIEFETPLQRKANSVSFSATAIHSPLSAKDAFV